MSSLEDDGVLERIRELIHRKMEVYHSEAFGDELDLKFGSQSSGDAGWESATFLEEEIVSKVLSMVDVVLKGKSGQEDS